MDMSLITCVYTPPSCPIAEPDSYEEDVLTGKGVAAIKIVHVDY